MHTFEIVTPDGEQLGRIELGRPDWPPRSVIYRGGSGPNRTSRRVWLEVELVTQQPVDGREPVDRVLACTAADHVPLERLRPTVGSPPR